MVQKDDRSCYEFYPDLTEIMLFFLMLTGNQKNEGWN